ncbi:Integration host factor subunit alpha [Nymphon striatum]|nr:Integration host factor subunit alpha [Nymphon striatum]
MTTLTKAGMVEYLFDELGLNKREAKELVEMFFEETRTALEQGKNIKLSGFGNFMLRDKAQRPGRNPKSGEAIPVCARRVVTFRPAHVLRYWEQEFPGLSPMKRRGNRRYYQRKDVVLIRQIRSLLHEQGYTISGARQKLSGEEAEIDSTQANQLSRQLITELEGVLKILKN